VTVKTMPGSSETGTGVVTASGNATGDMILGVYTAATGTFPATVELNVVSADALAAGDFCIVNVDISAGYYPTASSFAPPTLDEATGLDYSGDPLHPSSVTLTGELSLGVTAVVH
jgi:hypothetical protein